jgi:hypothetical protein
VKPLAFVAVRTDGDEDGPRDLREIAVLRVEPGEGHATDVFVGAVRSPRAGAGFDRGALWLVDAIDRVRHLTHDCVLVAWHGIETRRFLYAQCDAWELLPLELAPETLDARSLAWPFMVTGEAPRAGVREVATALGLPTGEGLLGEVQALAALHRLAVQRAEAGRRFAALGADERAIVATIVHRVGEGRRTYGEWRVDDGRKYPREALEEVMDALNYCAAELVRLGKGGAS